MEPILLKYRFHKQYRHPTLDTTLTKSRVAGEARAIIKCIRSVLITIGSCCSGIVCSQPLRFGVNVPGIRMVDAPAGVLGLEWVDGKSVRLLLGGGAEDEEQVADEDEDATDETSVEDPLREFGVSQGI